MKILVTGFDAFDQNPLNSSQEVLKQLPDQIHQQKIYTLQLPTEVKAATKLLKETLSNQHFDAIVSLGEASLRQDISIERIAINLMDFRIPDNAGFQPEDESIDAQGPAAYFLTLPIKKMLKACKEKEIAASISNSAGTYVCNHVSYWIAHRMVQEKRPTISGFIHLPKLTNQSKNLDLLVDGVETCLEVVINHLRCSL